MTHVQQPRSRRRQVGLSACAVTIEGSAAVLIENLSPTGAKLVGRSLPRPGSEFLLRTSKMAALARVRWATSSEIGIIFEEGAPSAGQCLALQLECLPAR